MGNVEKDTLRTAQTSQRIFSHGFRTKRIQRSLLDDYPKECMYNVCMYVCFERTIAYTLNIVSLFKYYILELSVSFNIIKSISFLTTRKTLTLLETLGKIRYYYKYLCWSIQDKIVARMSMEYFVRHHCNNHGGMFFGRQEIDSRNKWFVGYIHNFVPHTIKHIKLWQWYREHISIKLDLHNIFI